MTRKAAQTGPGAMVLVAIEQGFSEGQRILTDDLAVPILPFGSRFWVRLLTPFKNAIVRKTEINVPGLWGGIMARKIFIDDLISEIRPRAMVNLGAGFDTRAFRHPDLAETAVWEVDQKQNVALKWSRLRAIYGEVPDHVTLVPMNFDHQDLAEVLASHGYQAESATLFIMEGVTQYVTEPGIRANFDFLSTAPGGSRLVFTYTPRDFIDGSNTFGHDYLYARMRGKDPVWLSGFDPEAIDDFLGEYGWETTEHLGYDELGERYVQPTGRDLGWMAIERIVVAEK